MIYDKRKLKRHDIFLIVEFKPSRSHGGFSIGITRDLSLEGFSLEAQTIECKRGDTMEFKLKHPDAAWNVDISGEVIWRNHSWYKYITGVKFLKVSEEQSTKILKLMSAVRDEPEKPEPAGNDSGKLPLAEKEKLPEASSVSATVDNPQPDPAATRTSQTSSRGVECCELTGTEKTFFAGVVSDIHSKDNVEGIIPSKNGDNSNKGTEAVLLKDNGSNTQSAQQPDNGTSAAEHKKISSAKIITSYRQDKAHAPNVVRTDPSKNNRKKKLWLYLPIAMVVSIFFAIALPVMINKFNHDSLDSLTALTEITDKNSVEQDKAIPASDNVQTDSRPLYKQAGTSPVEQKKMNSAFLPEKDNPLNKRQASAIDNSSGIQPPGPIALAAAKNRKTEDTSSSAEKVKTIINTPPMNNTNIVKPQPGIAAKPALDNVGKSNKIDLIAKIDTTFKDLAAVQIDKPQEPKAVTETKKIPEDTPIVKTDEKPVPPQVAKLEEKPAVAAYKESERATTNKQEIKAPEEKKNDLNKSEPSVSRPEMPSVALLVKRNKSRTSNSKSPAVQGITSSDLIKKWKHIGSTKNGVPLFIAPDNISYPYEHVVNLLVKASVNSKDFIDLLAINCSQIKLRILEERNGNNPVFSSYSDEWKDIAPDNMILYNSACPEKK